MDLWYPDDDTPMDMGWWTPLMRFGLAMARAGLSAIDPDDFMLMGRIDRKGRPRIWLYKHIDTRRYVNVADDGTPYRYIPPKDWNSGYEGRYVLHRDPRVAWWHLDLLSLRRQARLDDLAELDDPDELADLGDPADPDGLGDLGAPAELDEPPGLEVFEDYELEDLDLPPAAPAAPGPPVAPAA